MTSGENDRPAAMLTNAQREYLRGENEYRPSVEREVRNRIRSRIRASMRDFLLIVHSLDTEDITQALERRADPEMGPDATPGSISDEFAEEIALDNGMAGAIGVVYLARLARKHHVSPPISPDLLTDTRPFEDRIEKGVRLMLNRLGMSADRVNASVELEVGTEVSDLAERDVSELADYSVSDLLQAFQAGLIDNEQFMAVMQEHAGEDETDEE